MGLGYAQYFFEIHTNMHIYIYMILAHSCVKTPPCPPAACIRLDPEGRYVMITGYHTGTILRGDERGVRASHNGNSL